MTKLVSIVFALLALGVQADATSLSDPTRPLNFAPSKASTSYTLTSVFRKADSSSAIINGQLIVVGQTRGDIQLISVSESSATIKTAAGIRTLTMHRKVKR